MDTLTTELWSRRIALEMQREALLSQYLQFRGMDSLPEPRPLTKQEKLAEIISGFMGYDGDPDGAAAAVMEFLSEY